MTAIEGVIRLKSILVDVSGPLRSILLPFLLFTFLPLALPAVDSSFSAILTIFVVDRAFEKGPWVVLAKRLLFRWGLGLILLLLSSRLPWSSNRAFVKAEKFAVDLSFGEHVVFLKSTPLATTAATAV